MAAASFTAAVLGGTGNVGTLVVQNLLKNERVGKVTLFTRRHLPEHEGNAKIKYNLEFEVVVPDLTESSAVDVSSHFQNTDALFITLGVGAPSKLPRSDEGKHELLRVDCLVPTAYASVAKSNGVPLVSILTAAGPDITSDYGFIMGNAAGGGWYRHVKGQVEQNLIDLKVSNLAIFRPAAIVGNRYLGDFGSWLMPKFDWMLPLKYNSIKQEDLAAAMVNHALNQPASAAIRQEPNVLIAEGESLFALVPPPSSS